MAKSRPSPTATRPGFAEPTPEQQDRLMKAPGHCRGGGRPARQAPRGRHLVAPSDGHLGPHDAADAQTITDGPFVRING